MIWQEFNNTVPTQWLLLTFGDLYSNNRPGFKTDHNFVQDFRVPRTLSQS